MNIYSKDNSVSSVIQYTLYGLVFALATVFLSYIFKTYSLQDFLPSRSDMVGYFLEAKGFAETGRVGSFVMMNENTSKILGTGPHGPFYAILHGTFAKLFGLKGINFVTMHLLFLAGYLAYVLRFKEFDLRQKLILTLLQFGYFTTIFFVFSFNQETIHIFFTAIVSFKFIELFNKHKDSDGIIWKDVIIFLSILFGCTLFRFGWALWSLGILALAKKRKDIIPLFITAASVAVMGHLYRMLFHSPDDYGLVKLATDMILNGEILKAISSIWDNVLYNINAYFVSVYRVHYYYYSKILYFIIAATVTYFGYKKKDKLMLGAGIIALVNLAALIVLYNAYDYREIRGLAPILGMLFIIIVYRKLKYLTLLSLIYTVISFPFIFPEFHWLIYDKCVVGTKLYLEKKVFDYSFMKRLPSNGKDIVTVLIPEKSFWQLAPGARPHIKNILHGALFTLPTKNNEGVPMRFTFNNHETDPAYKQWGKMDIDYILMPEKGTVVPNTPELKAKWLGAKLAGKA